MKNQLAQIRFSRSEKKYLYSPFLGKEIEGKVFNLKKKYDKFILLSSIISFFSLRISYEISRLQLFMDDSNAGQILKPIHGAFFLFFCMISGLFVDVFGIRSSWRYFTITNSLGQILLLLAQFSHSTQIKLMGQIIYFSLLPICIINFTCILYEASGELSTRLNNAIKFEVFGSMLPVVIAVLLQIILDQVNFETDQNRQYIIVITVFGICQILNFISLAILSKTYSVIHKLKQSSQRFIHFQINQGIFISLSKIAKKFSNIDIFYLTSISALCGFQSVFMYSFQINSSLQSNLGLLISFLFAMLVGYISIKKVNSSPTLVTTSYKVCSFLIYILFIYSLATIIQVKVFSNFYFATTISSIQGGIWIVSYVLIHQIVIFLLNSRCELRGISLSYTLFVYFFFFLIASLIEVGTIQFVTVQAVLSVFLVIINMWYMKQRQFNVLDKRITKMYSSVK